MQVIVSGQDRQGQTQKLVWRLYAPDGSGPYIPTFSTIILARKLLLAPETLTIRGAMPCLGLLSLTEFYPHFERFGIYHREQMCG